MLSAAAIRTRFSSPQLKTTRKSIKKKTFIRGEQLITPTPTTEGFRLYSIGRALVLHLKLDHL